MLNVKCFINKQINSSVFSSKISSPHNYIFIMYNNIFENLKKIYNCLLYYFTFMLCFLYFKRLIFEDNTIFF